ncbi:hypothetical protein N9R04_02375 [Staphylococcus sp. SQ8-PEA]|uniref:Transposase n=1 Tax=Staphylococcus marylandisciuri TaxID=2981529 RepID=A0ABT2QNM8_9STAP|nr:hypothetical protein [Staphylococcus marylandisciuri]
MCSECVRNDGKKKLKVREWSCPIYYVYHDQHINASINILTEALRLQHST